MCNEKGKYLMYGAYNICGTFLQFWLCEVFFTFQLLPLLCLLGFLGIHNEGSVIYLQIYRAWMMLKLSLPLRPTISQALVPHSSSLCLHSLVSSVGLCMILYWLIF